MTLKHLLLSLLLLFTVSAIAQNKVQNIQKIIFYKIINDGSISHKQAEINFFGKVMKGRETLASFDIKELADGIAAYLKTEDVKKVPANNDPLPNIDIPKPGQHSIYINVWLYNDYEREKSFENKTHYLWKAILPNNNMDYPIFKYLPGEEVDKLRDLLK